MFDIDPSPNLLTLLFLIAMSGFALAVLADHFQTLVKYIGARNGYVARGYNSAMKVMMFNRVGAVLYFLLIAFNIDNGLNHRDLTIGLSITVLLLIPPTIGILIFLQKSYAKNGITLNIADTSNWPISIVVATFVATSFNLIGLTVPWIAGSAIPELRLTLANSSFVFNTIFSLVNVFYIEHRFAQLVDRNEEKIHSFVAGVIVARLLAFIFVGLTLRLLV